MDSCVSNQGQWQLAVHKVINLQTAQNTAKFMSSQANVRFSRLCSMELVCYDGDDDYDDDGNDNDLMIMT